MRNPLVLWILSCAVSSVMTRTRTHVVKTNQGTHLVTTKSKDKESNTHTEAGRDYTDSDDWMDVGSYKENNNNDNKIDNNNNNGGYGETSQPETYKGKETPSDNGETSQPDSYKGKDNPDDVDEQKMKVEETLLDAGQSDNNNADNGDGYGETNQPDAGQSDNNNNNNNNGDNNNGDNNNNNNNNGGYGETSQPKRYDSGEKPEEAQNHVENGTCDEEPEVKVEDTVIGAGQSEKEKNNGHCRIHHECSGGEVCTKNGECQHIPCKGHSKCKEEVSLPSACKSIVPGGPKYCSSDKLCTDNKECAAAGKDFVCHRDSGQCKPSYGSCEITCDCLDNFGMLKGEALCLQTSDHGNHKKVCLCRSDHVAECGAKGEAETTTERVLRTPITIIHTPPPPITVIEDVVTDPGKTYESTTTLPPPITIIEDTVTDPGIVESGTCPLPKNNEHPGGPGAPCSVHGGCDKHQGLICAKPDNKPGVCTKSKCKKTKDCASATLLPSRCSRGVCKAKHCYKNRDCPRGYACDSGGECKKDLGSCKYDCDCSQCDAAECFNGHCICKAQHDMCIVAPGQDDAPNDESFVDVAPVDEGNADNVEGAHKYKADKVHQDDPATDGGADGDWEDVTPPVGDSNEQPPEEPQEQTQDQAQDQTQDTQQYQPQNQLSEPGSAEEPIEGNSNTGSTGIKYEAEKEFKEEHFESKNSQMKMCKTCNCPDGWKGTGSGCYKLFKNKADKVTRDEAQTMCEKEGGFVAEVTTRKEMVNLMIVFEHKIIPVWLGAKREGGKYKWKSGMRFAEDEQDEYEGIEGDCLIRKAQHKKVASCEEKFYVLCEVANIEPNS